MRIVQLGMLILMTMTSSAGEKPRGPFMGVNPTSEPQMMFPGWLSTRAGEYNGTFSPDGETFYYTLSLPGFDAIMVTRMAEDGRWDKPDIASFSGTYQEFDPLFAPDGTLYFSSHRPIAEASGDRSPSGIWRLDQKNNSVVPVHVPLSDLSDYYSSLTHAGVIYFNSRVSRWGTMDLFKAIPDKNGFRIENLGEVVNTGAAEADPWVAPDESYVIFRSYRREGLGGADLYISFNIDGQWSEAVNLGAPINSSRREMCPLVTADGKMFIFASDRFEKPYHGQPFKSLDQVWKKFDSMDNGNLNLYVTDTAFIDRLKQVVMAKGKSEE